MFDRLMVARRRFRSWLTPAQQRGVRVLVWAAVISVVGVAVTGAVQFFVHRSDPGWYGYVAGQGGTARSSQSGMAELHSLFGTATGVTALVGGAWFAYRVLFDIPKPAAIGLALAIAGMVSGSVMRFNLVKLRGREFEEAGAGYAQVFGTDLEFVVTDRFELGPTAIRLWSLGHFAIVPMLLIVIWFGLPAATDEAEGSLSVDDHQR